MAHGVSFLYVPQNCNAEQAIVFESYSNHLMLSKSKNIALVFLEWLLHFNLLHGSTADLKFYHNHCFCPWLRYRYLVYYSMVSCIINDWIYLSWFLKYNIWIIFILFNRTVTRYSFGEWEEGFILHLNWGPLWIVRSP